MHDLNEAVPTNVIARNIDSERSYSVQGKQVIPLVAAEMWWRQHSCSSTVIISCIFERNEEGNKVSCAITQNFISRETSCYKKLRNKIIIIIITIIIICIIVSCHRPFLPGTSLEQL
jgi:hypothetical protein